MKKVLKFKERTLVETVMNGREVKSETYKIPFEGNFNKRGIVNALCKKFKCKVDVVDATIDSVVVRFTL